MMKTTIFAILLLLVGSVNAQGLGVNLGAMTLGPIPAFFAEVEYQGEENSIRLNYVSNLDVNLLGSSKYDGAFLEYSFFKSQNVKKNSNYYISVGVAEKTNGSSSDSKFKFVGFGFERDLYNESDGRFFMRIYINVINEERDLPLVNQKEDFYLPFPGLLIGVGF